MSLPIPHKSLLLVGSLLLCLTSFAQVQREYIDLKNLHDKPIVETSINGHKAYFLLDTGSSVTVFHAQNAKRFGYRVINSEIKGAVDITTFGGDVKRLEMITKAKFYLGSTELKGRYFAFDLTDLIRSTKMRTGHTIAGILGSDVLRRYGFGIDYAEGYVWVSGTKKERKKQAKIDNESFVQSQP